MDWATVHHPPSVAVSYTGGSRNGERFCRFSINGHVADANAPLEFRQMAGLPTSAYVAMLQAGDVNRAAVITHFLLVADEEIEPEFIGVVRDIIDNHLEELSECFENFLFGQEFFEEFLTGGFRLTCKADGQMTITLTDLDTDIIRAVVFSSA
jgi:hypothetical protein